MTSRGDKRPPVDELAAARAFKRIDALLEAHPELTTDANLDRLRVAVLAADEPSAMDAPEIDGSADSPEERKR